MLASIPLCLVGWCWSVGWGISLLNIASNQAMKWKCLTRMDCLYLSCSDCFNSVHRQAACLRGKGADKITTRTPRGIFATRWNEAQNRKAWHHVAWVEELVLDLIFTPNIKLEPGLAGETGWLKRKSCITSQTSLASAQRTPPVRPLVPLNQQETPPWRSSLGVTKESTSLG